MSRINTNVSSMLAQRVLSSQSKGLVTSLERLSTGMRINRGSDDPAGLIASENLRAEKAALNSAIGNAQRAEQVMNIAEGGLQEISNLLLNLQSLVSATANDAGVSAEEKEANQLQIDSILQTIDRLANSTSFQGVKLLNGNFDYTTSGVSTSDISDLKINSARISNTAGAYINVTVDVLTSGQTGVVYLETGEELDNDDDGSITLEIAGTKGVQQFTFASGTSQANIIAAINTFTDSLGLVASQSDDDDDFVKISSSEYGSSAFVRVRILQGTTNGLVYDEVDGTGQTSLTDHGRDAVVLINGIQAKANGLTARISTDGLDLTVRIDGASDLNKENGSTEFAITGGGASFNLTPRVDLAGKVSIGLQTMTTGSLGDAEEGYLSSLKAGGSANVVNGNLSQAQRAVEAAIKQVASQRGRLGAFQKNVVGATINSLSVALENTTAAESVIRDTDFAKETAELMRHQILSQAAAQALAMANSMPTMVLQLLRA